MSPAIPEHLRLNCAIEFKNHVTRRWTDVRTAKKNRKTKQKADTNAANQPLQANERAALRPQLVRLVAASPPLLRKHFALAARAVAAVDFPTHWPTLIEEIGLTLSSEDENTRFGGLLVMRHVLKVRSLRVCAQVSAHL